MSIIIRLQNLPWEANSLDIRRYFQGLSIPDGGVHIIGGDKGDAFIAFSSDEDARQAMARDGGMVKDSRIKLFLSSRSEMQKVIEQARIQTLGTKGGEPPLSAPPPVSEMPGMHLQALNSSSVSAVPSSLAASAHAGGYGKSDFRRRSDDRDMVQARNMNDRSVIDHLSRSANSSDHSGALNRSRSRSPFGRGDPSSYSRHHPDDPRVKMDSDLLAAGPMSGIHSIPPSGYNPNIIPPLRSGPLDGPLGLAGGGGVGGNGPHSNPLISSRSGYLETSKDPGMLGISTNGRANMHHNPWSRGVGGEDMYNNYGPPNDAMKNERMLGNDKHSAYSNQHGNTILNHAQSRITVELRGLSFNIVPRDIQEFFRPSGLYLPEEDIQMIVNDRGYPTGCAILHLNTERDLEVAMTRNGCFMGDRRIEVMPIPESLPPPPRDPEEMLRSGGHHGHPGGGGGINSRSDLSAQGMPPQCDFVVYMKGIPYNSCTTPDVSDFFHGLDCVDILFEVDSKTGKPAGNAYVEFASKEDFNAALEMNMKHMGKRYIEIFPTTRDDMNEARRISMGGSDRNMPRGDIAPRQNFCISVTNLPPTMTNRDLTNYFTDLGAQPFAIHIMLKPNGYNAGEAFVEFVSRDQQSKAIRRDGTYMASHRISVRPVAYDVMRRIVGLPHPSQPAIDNMRSYPGGGGGGGGGHGELNDPRMRDGKSMRGRGRGDDFRRRVGGNREDKIISDPSRQPSFNDPRCVIIAQNIPYRATNEDICVFFSDFSITPECIMRRVNDKGQVAADCKIAFRSPEDASRAVKMMHKKYLIGRPVFLRLESSTI